MHVVTDYTLTAISLNLRAQVAREIPVSLGVMKPCLLVWALAIESRGLITPLIPAPGCRGR